VIHSPRNGSGIITGDRDFEGVDVERHEVLTIAEFMEKYS
jgi:hypothetical protein